MTGERTRRVPVHLEYGARNAIAFVFSCPGREEQSAGCPAAGQTGRNLEDALCFMRGYNYDGIDNVASDDWTRGNILITNAWPRVEFQTQTGRSEASAREVLCENNVQRLAGELGAITEVIVCCGARARAVVCRLYDRGLLADGVRIASLCHLSNQALNGRVRNCELPASTLPGVVGLEALSSRRRRERIRRWVVCLWGQVTAASACNATT